MPPLQTSLHFCPSLEPSPEDTWWAGCRHSPLFPPPTPTPLPAEKQIPRPTSLSRPRRKGLLESTEYLTLFPEVITAITETVGEFEFQERCLHINTVDPFLSGRCQRMRVIPLLETSSLPNFFSGSSLCHGTLFESEA